MFTGIIRHLGHVGSVRTSSRGIVLSVRAGPVAEDANIGDSVCVSGVCLTVKEKTGGLLGFDVSGETLSLTTLGHLAQGAPVNLEPSLRPSDRMGGHFVTGHVDGTGSLTRRTERPGETRLTFRTDEVLTRMMVLKGSVAVDGVSLTLTDVSEGNFGVVLVPHTLSVTTLGSMVPGDRVNIETDLIGKWVLKALGSSGGGLTEDFLREHGFA
ncbi:MAG TPA: riboflavin synthase [Planctomycetota bacterium]|nr:riboflavin synthase [Planctomycetota bacterium]